VSEDPDPPVPDLGRPGVIQVEPPGGDRRDGRSPDPDRCERDPGRHGHDEHDEQGQRSQANEHGARDPEQTG
jgi:hypothetical protein